MPKLRITLCASRGWTVSYSCINTKSAWRSAADVKVLLTSSIFLPVRSRPPCCNTPHNIQLCRLKGVESRAPPGHRPPDTCAYESQQQCQHHHQHASYSCLTHACKTKLSVCTQSRSGRRIYYPQTAKWPWWQKCSPLHFEAKTCVARRLLGGLRLVLCIMQCDIVWLNAPSPNWIPTNASSRPCLDKYWWKITASALIKEMEHFDPTLN